MGSRIAVLIARIGASITLPDSNVEKTQIAGFKPQSATL
jgi:hypothetical protein